jgi:oxygen-dependent protoporphyrinogen oxidase
MAGARQIIVIGGGLAGLGAAFRLQRLGYQVEVLEKEGMAGGRMRSEERDGYVIERGAQFIASSYRNMLALGAELGIRDRVAPLGNTRNAVLRDGRFRLAEYEGLKSFGRSRDLSWAAKARLCRILLPLWLHRRQLDFYRPEVAARLDDEDAASYVLRLSGREVLEYLVEPAFAGTFTVLPENMSRAFLLSTMATLFRGFRLLSFAGGNGALTSALAAAVPLRTGVTVDRVEAGDDGVTVWVADSPPLRAAAAVLAVPGTAVNGLCPTLAPEEARFFRGVRYAASMIVFVMAGREALPTFYGAGFPRREGVRLYGMAVENAKAGVVPEGKVLFNCALAEDLAAELWGASDDRVISVVRGELDKLPLRGLYAVEGYEVHRWPALVPQFYPGYHRAIAGFLARKERSPRLFFAGDYLVGPYTEAALTSGLRAADDVASAFPAAVR